MSDDPNGVMPPPGWKPTPPTPYEVGHAAGRLYVLGHAGLSEREQQERAYEAGADLKLDRRDLQHFVRGWLQGYREASE